MNLKDNLQFFKKKRTYHLHLLAILDDGQLDLLGSQHKPEDFEAVSLEQLGIEKTTWDYLVEESDRFRISNFENYDSLLTLSLLDAVIYYANHNKHPRFVPRRELPKPSDSAHPVGLIVHIDMGSIEFITHEEVLKLNLVFDDDNICLILFAEHWFENKPGQLAEFSKHLHKLYQNTELQKALGHVLSRIWYFGTI